MEQRKGSVTLGSIRKHKIKILSGVYKMNIAIEGSWQTFSVRARNIFRINILGFEAHSQNRAYYVVTYKVERKRPFLFINEVPKIVMSSIFYLWMKIGFFGGGG